MEGFVLDRQEHTRNAWLCLAPQSHYYKGFRYQGLTEFWLGTKIAVNGSIDICLSGYVPLDNPGILELSSGYCLGESDPLAALRGACLLEHLVTNSEEHIGSDLVEAALAACSRACSSRVDELARRILKQPGMLDYRDRLMAMVPDDLSEVVTFLAGHRRAKFSTEPFKRELAAGLIGDDVCELCLSVADITGSPSDIFTGFLFPVEEIEELRVREMMRKRT